jgi:hypothetical protein
MKRMLTWIMITAALVTGGLNAQTSRPKLKDFKTLEAYVEALVDWKLDQRQAQTQQPTATEIFNLRTQCKAMADKEWLTTAAASPKDIVVHWAYYIPRTNHCYVEIKITSFGNNYVTSTLHDAQSGEELANAMETIEQPGKPKREFGRIPGQDPSKTEGHEFFMRALEYMSDLTREQ